MQLPEPPLRLVTKLWAVTSTVTRNRVNWAHVRQPARLVAGLLTLEVARCGADGGIPKPCRRSESYWGRLYGLVKRLLSTVLQLRQRQP